MGVGECACVCVCACVHLCVFCVNMRDLSRCQVLCIIPELTGVKDVNDDYRMNTISAQDGLICLTALRPTRTTGAVNGMQYRKRLQWKCMSSAGSTSVCASCKGIATGHWEVLQMWLEVQY